MSRLYLVDDHALVRDGLRAVLEAAGHAVVGEACEQTKALADVARLQPDVLLLDLHLGERSGFELLDELQRRKLPTKVIVLTMSSEPRHVAEALRMGALAYVLKGSATQELLQAIAAVAEGRRYLGQGEAELAVRGLTEPGDVPAATLSARELQVLKMVARGASSAAIGEELHLSPKTVDSYRSRAMAKLGLGDVPALVRWAIREGLVDLGER